jgi:hypothetical protein
VKELWLSAVPLMNRLKLTPRRIASTVHSFYLLKQRNFRPAN